MRFIAVIANRTSAQYAAGSSPVVSAGHRQSPRTVPLLLLIISLLGIAAGVPSLRAQSQPPYPPSPVIRRADWDFTHLIRLANTPGKGGSDLWPVTWAKDGNVYAGWGDGGGFSGASDNAGRVSLGFARILGEPPEIHGVDVWGSYPKYAAHPAQFCGKPVGMISVSGALYAWVSSSFNESAANFVHCSPNPKGREHRLAWSDDLGATWTLSPWKVGPPQHDVRWCSFLNFGRDNSHARDASVYQYWQIEGQRSSTFLVRVPADRLKAVPDGPNGYEYYAGPGPTWSKEFAAARPVFVDPSCRGITHVVYNAGIERYIASAQGDTVGETGLFDAPEPWGPWTTIRYDQNWGGFGERESLGVDFPTKWISPDGRVMWAVFSGGRLGKGDDILDSFNLVKVTLVLSPTGAVQPSRDPSNGR
ncbi:MAG: DUF4185 domain-containing protein [Terriglobia bacterium]